MTDEDRFTRIRTAVVAAAKDKGRASTAWRRHLVAMADVLFFLSMKDHAAAVPGLSACVRLAVRKEHPNPDEVPTTVLGSLRYLGVALVVERPSS